MDVAERDSTQDWLLPGHSTPPLIGELEQRIEEALASARASEAVVMTIGAAAFDAADQARRAAELAERASAMALAAQKAATPPAAVSEDDGLRDFTARADRIVARLRQLERVPLPAPSTSDPVGPLRFPE
jgi:hypothetical protein